MAAEEDSVEVSKPHLPWLGVTSDSFTNAVAYEISRYIKSSKTSWSVPAAFLSKHLDGKISPVRLAASCSYVKLKREKLMRNRSKKLAEYLQTPFRVPYNDVQVKNNRKKRARVDHFIMATVRSPEEKDRLDTAKRTYESLLLDYHELRAAHSKLQLDLKNSKATVNSHDHSYNISPSAMNAEQKKDTNYVQPGHPSQRNRGDTWKAKYFALKKTRTTTMELIELRNSVARLHSLNSSQRQYYKRELEAAKEQQAETTVDHSDCLMRENGLKARVCALEEELSKLRGDAAKEQQAETNVDHSDCLMRENGLKARVCARVCALEEELSKLRGDAAK